MGFLSDNKPHTAVTTTIERLTSEQYDEEDIGEIVELLELINIQPTGPTEAARALRKKLKYGNRHKQLRALTLLDALVENGNKRLDPLYNDDMLLERLRQTAMEPMTDQRVKRKIRTMATVWSREYANSRGKERLAALHRNIPSLGGNKPAARRRTLGDADRDDAGPSSSSSPRGSNRERASSNPPPRPAASVPKKLRTKGSSGSRRKVDMAKERPRINTTIAEASTSATNLKNALQLVNRDHELSTENEQATELFERCKKLRRQILRYIQVVESEDYIGSLIHANEELISALKVYEKMSKPLGEDSESDWNVENRMRNLNVSSDESETDSGSDSDSEYERPPPRQRQQQQEYSNPDNPFDDSHMVEKTPEFEKAKPF